MQRMIDINPLKSAIASILAALTGSVSNYCSTLLGTDPTIDTMLQRLAWTVAIIAGVMSIINSVRKWCKKEKHVPTGENEI